MPTEIRQITLYADYQTRRILCDFESTFEDSLEKNHVLTANSVEEALTCHKSNDYPSVIIFHNLADENSISKAEKFALQIAAATGRTEIHYDDCDEGTEEFRHADMKIVGISEDEYPIDIFDFHHLIAEIDWREYTKEEAWPAPKFSVVSATDIAGRKTEEKPLISGLCNRGEATVWAAAAAAGKSALMRFIALVLACQSSLFELFDIPVVSTSLLIQSENLFGSTSQQLRKLFAARPELKDGANKFCTLTMDDDCRVSGDVTNPDFYKPIMEQAANIGADLLIFDPLISFHQSVENDNTSMRKTLDALQRVVDEAGLTVFITHHFGREGRWRGASAIRDWASNMFLMEVEKVEKGEALLKITHDKARNFCLQDPFYLLRTKDLDFRRVEKPGTKQEQWVKAVVESLVGLGGSVEKQGPLCDSVSVLLNCSPTGAKRAIAHTCEVRKIFVSPGGNGKATGYYLPGHEPKSA